MCKLCNVVQWYWYTISVDISILYNVYLPFSNCVSGLGIQIGDTWWLPSNTNAGNTLSNAMSLDIHLWSNPFKCMSATFTLWSWSFGKKDAFKITCPHKWHVEKPTLTLDRVKVVFSGHHGQFVFRLPVYAMRCCQHPVFVDYGSTTHMSGRHTGDELQRYLPRELTCTQYN